MRAANIRLIFTNSKQLIYNLLIITFFGGKDFVIIPILLITLYDMTELAALGFLRLTLIDILDIVVVAVLLFMVFRWIRGSSAMNIFIAIIMLLLIRILSSALGMKMLSSIMGTVIDVGAIALIIIFQPEIRRFLNNIGRSAGDTLGKRGRLLARLLPRKSAETLEDSSIREIAEACTEMSEQLTGALIIIKRNHSLEDIINTGDIVDARISKRLIMNIFFKNSPLHDGAMVIADNRITAARCTLPITDRTDIPAHYGMRHKAALGISEQCDADVIVVSEQTGRISHAYGGNVETIDSPNALKLILGGKNNDGRQA